MHEGRSSRDIMHETPANLQNGIVCTYTRPAVSAASGDICLVADEGNVVLPQRGLALRVFLTMFGALLGGGCIADVVPVDRCRIEEVQLGVLELDLTLGALRDPLDGGI